MEGSEKCFLRCPGDFCGGIFAVLGIEVCISVKDSSFLIDSGLQYPCANVLLMHG